MAFELPKIPVPHDKFIHHLAQNQSTHLRELVEPYIQYEAKLREGFAQHRDHPSVQDPNVNVVPIFAGHEDSLKIRARDPEKDSEAERYLMPLKSETRRADGSPAMAHSLKLFKQNFSLFSEQSLVDMDWSNVVAAGSSVVTAMLPVPEEHSTSKRALREYYHKKLAPSSDVDLFIWGLDEKAAVKKIAEIEECVRNSILAETTTIRTKNAITIVSQYPTRHIQIVLRLYKSVSEILTGFDVDCSCFAFDGEQVYAAPRGITSFLSQSNTIDLTRRSPSYESRLAKYSHRGFEVYYSDLDRKRIDPTVYDRSFVRTWGLARLLVLERLPKESDREAYLNQRRQERGRPPLNTWHRRDNQLPGNMKDDDPEDIAEWDFEADVSNYHTFTIPYGPRYHARRIERLLYVKDMLLNAEWNHKRDRKVNLHRHPCFIGDVASVIHDCCGECPEATSDEEIAILEEERKIYVHGEIEFMKDDPGRQAIGSFHPLTSDDWTDMAYLGNTQELCAAIVDGDIDAVNTWVAQEENDVNKRDHTGRTPLQFAVICGRIEILKVLIDAGARITSRVADGFTALHMAASVGRADMIKVLAAKSDENEENEAKKEVTRNAERRKAGTRGDTQMTDIAEKDRDSDAEMIDADEAESDEDDAMTQGSYVKVEGEAKDDDNVPEDDAFGPDVYDANVLAWDTPVSPLHVAILSGHIDAIDALVSAFGADVLLPVKLKDSRNTAILNLVLASQVSLDKSPTVVKKLIELGAKPSQSDIDEVSALHGAVTYENVPALKAMLHADQPSAQTALKFINFSGYSYYSKSATYPLMTAVRLGNLELVKTLLEAGATPSIEYEDFREAWIRYKKSENSYQDDDDEQIRRVFAEECVQPISEAIGLESPDIALLLLDHGADVNTIDSEGHRVLRKGTSWKKSTGKTLLDRVRNWIRRLENQTDEPKKRRLPSFKSDKEYLEPYAPGSYQYVVVKRDIELARLLCDAVHQQWVKAVEEYNGDEQKKEREKQSARAKKLKDLAAVLESKGAKGFYELHPKHHKAEDSKHESKQDSHGHKRDLDEMEDPYWMPRMSFKDPRVNDRKKEAYIKLFDAALQGDIDTIKSLTLKEIDDGQGKPLPPLNIATSDNHDLTPLSIAIAKGNIQLAKSILDIASVQYRPEEKKEAPKRRFRIMEDPYDYDYNDGSEEGSDAGDEVPLTSELVNDKFTIEDLGQLGDTVGSSVKPSVYLTWSAPFWAFSESLDTPVKDARRIFEAKWEPDPDYDQREGLKKEFGRCVLRNWGGSDPLNFSTVKTNKDVVKFLLQAVIHHTRIEEPDTSIDVRQTGSWGSQFIDGCLHYCIRKNKMDIAELLITEHGAGMPIDQMFEDVEVPEDEQEKPQYYQGLKLYGKHKTTWAAQAAGQHAQGKTDWRSREPAPFLRAVYLENRRSIEFWQSDASGRMYEAFGQRHQDQKKIRLLARKFGSWQKLVAEWLGMRRDLALHCTVIRGSRESQRLESPESTKYLMSTVPKSLNKKSVEGYDPLWLAFYYRQPQNARLFIEAGANQNTRERRGLNIVHALVSQPFPLDARNKKKELDDMEALLQLVDSRVLPELFLDRCSLGPSGLTPLALMTYNGHRDVQLFEMLEKYMPAEAFSMFDGAGQTPIHKFIISGRYDEKALVEQIIRSHPELLTLENGSGQTPFDLASTRYMYMQAFAAPEIPIELDVERKKSRNQSWALMAYEMIRKMSAEHESAHGPDSLKRRAISVRDASEISKRLAERNRKDSTNDYTQGYGRYRNPYQAYQNEDDNKPHDEVEIWHTLYMDSALQQYE